MARPNAQLEMNETYRSTRRPTAAARTTRLSPLPWNPNHLDLFSLLIELLIRKAIRGEVRGER